MTKRFSFAPLYFLALCGMAGSLVGQSILLGETKLAKTVRPEPTSFHDVVKNVLPAVVTIESNQKVSMAKAEIPGLRGKFGDLPGLPDELRKKFEEFGQQPFEPQESQPRHAFGSGFIVDPKGVILTNEHVVHGAKQVEVHLQDGRKFFSKNIKTDPKTDLAIVKLDVNESLPALEMGDSDAMEIGDRVLAVGAPLGMTGTVTSGIISAKGRDIHMNMYEDFLQTDAAINPGNSGGPLVNLDGKVIGINSAIKSRTGGFQGIGLAVSSNLAKNVMSQLLKDGNVHRGFLGVQVAPLSPEVAKHLGLANADGVVISKVSAGAPAAKAGLKEGDIVTTLAGKPIKDVRGLQRAVTELPLGQPVDVTLWRDGVSKQVSVTIEEQPRAYGLAAASADSGEQDAESSSLDKVGMTISQLTPERAKKLGYAEKTTGVVISEIEPQSMAAEAGLRKGALILKVDQQAVKTVTEAKSAIEKGSLEKGVLLQVKAPDAGTTYVLLKSAAS
ncbi:MAG TPA: Do family serine endopeptidase [Gemmataceae bacterium]|jgi:serine protease Do|nr:Do family serine endopeptidase [Gemmataceae bacterium]